MAPQKKRKTPCSDAAVQPPTRSIFQTLPPELLHAIFSHVERTKDSVALRLTCSLFASVGLDHFEPEVPLVFHRDKFKALTEIAAHSKLSKHMRSLFYVGDRCRLVSYESWDKSRPDPRPWERDDIDWTSKLSTDREIRIFQREARKMASKLAERTAAVPESERRVGYEVFTALCQDVMKVESESYDLQCLRVFFEGCTKIREVTVTSAVDTRRELMASRRVVEGAMTRTSCDRQWWTTGIRQVLSVAMAVYQTGTKLDSLTLAAVSPFVFDKNGHIKEDQWNALKALVQPLHRLRLFTSVVTPDLEDQDFESDPEEPDADETQMAVDDLLQEGSLHELLSTAKDLRVLKLQMPSWDFHGGEGPLYSMLESSLQDIHWPHLYELSLSSCELRSDYLVDLCLRHKSTLNRLSFFDLQTSDWETSWKEILTSLSGKLPELRLMKLRGSFHVCGEEDMSFEIAGLRSRTSTVYRDALEKFVIKGGPA